jgi:hypothetical protein
MKGRKHRAAGGVVDRDESPKEVYSGSGSNVVKEAEERKRGGRVKDKPKEMGKIEGKMSKMRLDRPGRKMGGRVGADKSPLSSAAGGENPSDQGHSEECD